MFNKIKNSINKVISLVLSFSVLVCSSGVSANNQVSTPEKSVAGSKKFERFSKCAKEHPVITAVSTVGALGAAALIVWGGATLADEILYKVCLRDVTTAVDNMTDDEVISYRDKAINEFKTIGQGKFDVDRTAIDKLPPRVLALFMGQINMILKAYPNIFRKYREYVLQQDRFIITVADSKQLPNEACAQYMPVSKHLVINEDMAKVNLDRFLSDTNRSKKFGHLSTCDFDKLIESLVAHEMGHVIHHTIAAGQMLCPNPLMPLEVSKVSYQDANMRAGKGYTKISYEAFLFEPVLYMKKDVLKTAKEKFGYTGNGYISKYGKTNDMEWFAEVCAHAFCSKEPNALGKAMQEFLKEQNDKYGKVFAQMIQAG